MRGSHTLLYRSLGACWSGGFWLFLEKRFGSFCRDLNRIQGSSGMTMMSLPSWVDFSPVMSGARAIGFMRSYRAHSSPQLQLEEGSRSSQILYLKFVFLCVQVHVCVSLCRCMCACTGVRVCLCRCICVSLCRCMCACTSIHVCLCRCMCACTVTCVCHRVFLSLPPWHWDYQCADIPGFLLNVVLVQLMVKLAWQPCTFTHVCAVSPAQILCLKLTCSGRVWAISFL